MTDKSKTVVWKRGQDIPGPLIALANDYRDNKETELKLVYAEDAFKDKRKTVPPELEDAMVAIEEAIDAEFEPRYAEHDKRTDTELSEALKRLREEKEARKR